MKNFLIIVLNIFILAIIFFACDFYVFQNEAKRYLPQHLSVYKYYKGFISRDTSKSAFDKKILQSNSNSEIYHPVLNENSKQKPIVLFGCSYVYGHKIPIEKSMHRVLSKYTARPLYDRSFHGWGTNQMLYQLKSPDFYKIIPQTPQTIIYIYIPDHIRRLYQPCLYSISDYYGAFFSLKKDNLLKERKNSFLYSRFNSVARVYDKIFAKTDKEGKKQFLLEHLTEAKNCADAEWKDAKFVILEYFSDEIFDEIKPELQKKGFVIIDRNDLVKFDEGDEKYCLGKFDGHPNDKAWEALMPKLIKYID